MTAFAVGFDGVVVDKGVATAGWMVGLLGDEGLEILVDVLLVVDFGEDAVAFSGELGGPMEDARRFGSVEGEACAEVGAADVHDAVGERDADTHWNACYNPVVIYERRGEGSDESDLLAVKVGDRRRLHIKLSDAGGLHVKVKGRRRLR